MPRIGVVAALKREVWPLIRTWPRRTAREPQPYTFYEAPAAVLVCGGIGPLAATRAAEALVALHNPALLVSAGFAGALEPGLRVGSLCQPARVLDAATGTSYESGSGAGTLVSTARVRDFEEKALLRREHQAVAVDMEAAAVAAVAKAHGIHFLAVKAIHDDCALSLPSFHQFIDSYGRFRTARYVAHVGVRPWTWPLVYRMWRNSREASYALCAWLGQFERPLEVERFRGQAVS